MSLSVHGDYDDFTVVLYIQRCLKISQTILAFTEDKLKYYKHIRRIRQAQFSVYGEYADPYMYTGVLYNGVYLGEFLTKNKKKYRP
jgi:hypothetical protein